ncbi:MAG: hypothetical protein GY953_49010, partial [bacterium]|nr:hypothetical protein [bacterium]
TVSSLVARLEAESAAVAVCPLLVDDDGAPATRAGALPTPSVLCEVWKKPDPWRQPIPSSPVPAEELENETVEVECPDPRAVLVRTVAVKGMNYFDERYGHFGSNLELAAQALRAGKQILLVPGVKAVTRNGEGLWQPEHPAAEADLRGDFGTGVIAYAGKHFGFGASLKARLRMLAGSLIGVP